MSFEILRLFAFKFVSLPLRATRCDRQAKCRSLPGAHPRFRYHLIHLREHKGDQEFRTVTGGVFHVSGGSTRDSVPFQGKQIAPRTFVVDLTNVPAGEYGFLPPGMIAQSSASSQLGKMYTFHVLE
ncbi:MAG TPA: hypothetical protein VMX16_17295 [Terriglobia bacterium]|nr:hypothetical protein [Terriglobia bacterium]